MVSKKIVVTPRGFAKCGIENAKIMEAAGFDVVYNDTGLAYTQEEFCKVTEGADGVIVGVETVDRDYIDSHPTLKAVVKFGVGTDNIDVEYCKEKGIFVGRTVGSNARSVAETAISFVIADSKNLYNSIANTREHGWAKMTGYEIQGKTIGIIGFGAIGKEVAKMAWGLGMRVLAYDVCDICPEMIEKFNVEVASVEEIIKRSDFLSLHMPLTHETKNMISSKELNQMKSNAVLINTASQRELAELSGVPIRTIQQYEQRQKRINKAQVEYLLNLSKALCCEMECLIEKVEIPGRINTL